MRSRVPDAGHDFLDDLHLPGYLTPRSVPDSHISLSANAGYLTGSSHTANGVLGVYSIGILWKMFAFCAVC